MNEPEPPRCPNCGERTVFMSLISKKGELPEVRSYGCQQCMQAVSVEIDTPSSVNGIRQTVSDFDNLFAENLKMTSSAGEGGQPRHDTFRHGD
jgi:uncharacterized Zn finger protein